MSMTEEARRPLRSTQKREQVIQQIKDVCRELGIAIEVDLTCYTYAELVLAHVRLQLGKKAREDGRKTQEK